MAEEFQLGDIVDVDGYSAIIRFIGETTFAPGIWIGVEFAEPRGKNNGTVQEVRYFSCPDKCGMFVKPEKPSLIDRASSVGGGVRKQHRQSTASGVVRSGSISGMASPTGSGSGRIGMPTPQRPTALGLQRSSTGLSSASSGVPSPRTGTPTAPGRGTPTSGSQQTSRSGTPAARPGSMGPPALPATKPTGAPARRGSAVGPLAPNSQARTQSIPASKPASQQSQAASPVGGPGSRQSLSTPKPALARKTSTGGASVSSGRGTPDSSASGAPVLVRTRTQTISGGKMAHVRRDSGALATESKAQSAKNRQSIANLQTAIGSTPPLPSPGTESPASSRHQTSTVNQQASNKMIEELTAKLKVLEKKGAEYKDKLQHMEKLQQERDKFETIIQKLQTKYQPQQEELRELRKQFKEVSAHLEELENAKAEHEIIVEMATLDKEMAEEQAEYYKTELDVLRAKAEELEAENDILKEENQELSGEMSTEERTSTGWIQMEKQNERLREALLRLREITQQAEVDLKEQIKSLEEDNEQLRQYKEQYEHIKEKLVQTESAVEDLRQQLDTALGAEEMLEELTERNMNMAEQVEELKATIEDLESLKELNDELEINHVETEKQMQEELDYKDLVILEQAKRIAHLDASKEEAEYTITRFRDLVASLQSDLEDMKASHQLTEAEAEELSARSRAMMDLNMKLQLTATKAQNKTIDLELQRMEAEQAAEHLSIVKMFLPEAFFNERDSILTILRFKRVGFKADLLHTFVKERIQSGHVQSGEEDAFMTACEIFDELTWLSSMCHRFARSITSCTVHQFAKYRGALHELDPVERTLNFWIEALRKGDLKERQCAEDLKRTIAVIAHLGEIHLVDNLEGYAHAVQMKVQLMQSHMESAAAAVQHIRNIVQQKAALGDDEEEIAGIFAKKAEAIVSHCRSNKVVVGKILRALNDLQARSLSLTTDTRQFFQQCEGTTEKIAKYARALGEAVTTLLCEEGRTEPIIYADVHTTMFKTTEKTIEVLESDPFNAFGKELRNLTNLLVDLASMASDLDITAEFERPQAPWVIRALELKNTKVVNVDVEEELRRLKDDIVERATQIKLRDKALEEAGVKIELLEARMRNVGKQAQVIENLEKQLEEGAVREKAFADTVDTLTAEIQGLESDVQKLKKSANEKRLVEPGEMDKLGIEKAVATAREVNNLKFEISSLQGAVNFLREENHRLRKIDLMGPNSWLLDPLPFSQKTKLSAPSSPLAASSVESVTPEWLSTTTESTSLINELINFVTSQAKVTKLSDCIPANGNRQSWRPAASTPTYKYWRQREQYEILVSWGEDIVSRTYKEQEKGKPKDVKKGLKNGEVKVGLAVPMRAGRKPGEKEIENGMQIRIRDPEAWEGFKERLGLVM